MASNGSQRVPESPLNGFSRASRELERLLLVSLVTFWICDLKVSLEYLGATQPL